MIIAYNTRKEETLAVSELREKLKTHAEPKKLLEKAQWMFVSKHYYDQFMTSVEGKFQKFIVKYCDHKLQTNPRWAYHAYKKIESYLNNQAIYTGTYRKLGLKYIEPKKLADYKFAVKKDFPLKQALVTMIMSTAINIAFNDINIQSLSRSCIVILAYFVQAHILSLIMLDHYQGYYNAKNLFNILAGGMVLVNLFYTGAFFNIVIK